MLALVEWIGLTVLGSPFSEVALRLGFILLFAGSTWLMARIAGRWYGPWAGFHAALALNLTGYYGLAASTFALPDGPLLFFWLLTIDRLSLALEQPGRNAPWVWVGLAWGGAMLSKYHAVFLPAGTVLFLLSHRPMRFLLAKPGPYLAIALGLLVFSPVLVWNASHGWVSFLFQGGRAVGGLVLRPESFLTALVAQSGYLFPWIWIPLMLVLARDGKNWARIAEDHRRLALWLAIPPVTIFAAVACVRPVLPHWGLIGLVSLFPALGQIWQRDCELRPASALRWLVVAAVFPVVLLGLTILEYRTGCFQRTGNSSLGFLDARSDPTAELYGWDQLAERLDRMGILDDPKVFLFTRTWFQSAQVAHAIHLKRPVLCYNIDDPRGFAFWSDPAEALGRDGILLMINEDYFPESFFRRWFHDATPLDDFWIERGGKPIRHVRAIRLVNQTAVFPFDFSPARVAAREKLQAGVHPLSELPQTARSGEASIKVPR
jgi:hypothetical protein